MLRYVTVIVLVLSLGCSSVQKSSSDLIIPEEQLVPVLVDLYLVFALQTTREFRDLANQYDSVDVHSDLFAKHHITKEQLDSTFSYLSKNPEELIDIFDQVIMQLNQMQDSIKVLPE